MSFRDLVTSGSIFRNVDEQKGVTLATKPTYLLFNHQARKHGRSGAEGWGRRHGFIALQQMGHTRSCTPCGRLLGCLP